LLLQSTAIKTLRESIQRTERQNSNNVELDKIQIKISDLEYQIAQIDHSSKDALQRLGEQNQSFQAAVLRRLEALETSQLNQQQPSLDPFIGTHAAELDNLKSDLHKLQHDVRTNEKNQKELTKINEGLEQKFQLVADCLEKINPGKTVESHVQSVYRELFTKDFKIISKQIDKKVDLSVLEELSKHIVTKQQVKKYFKKYISTNKNLFNTNNSIKENKQMMMEELDKRLERIVDQIMESLHVDIQEQLDIVKGDAALTLKNNIEKIEKDINLLSNKISQYKQSDEKESDLEMHLPARFEEQEFYSHPMIRRLARDFDEKMHVLCTEVSDCKTLMSLQARQPFYRCGQWLWNSGTLKQGSAVPWNLETVNTG
jgi:hypothetical protein